MDCRVYGGDESQGGGMEEGKVADAGNQEGNHHVYTATYSTTRVTVRLFRWKFSSNYSSLYLSYH